MKTKIFLLLAIVIIAPSIFMAHGLTPKKPVYIFTHGLWDDPSQANYFLKYGVIPKDAKWYAPPGLELKGWPPHFWKSALAQEADVEALREFCASLEADQIIGIGVSKGASTWINAAARIPNLKALILESPFTTAHEVFDNVRKKYVGWLPGSAWMMSKLTKLFRRYNPAGLHPIDTLALLPKDVPVLIIHSAEDALIPIEHSQRLYQKLVSHGHKNVHFVAVKNGKHARLVKQAGYQEAVQFFLSRYGLI